MAPEAGQLLLQYRLIEKIGEGGMGAVWRAEDTTLDREAAVKLLPAELAEDAHFLARFEREAKLLASLSNPNLAAVYGVHVAGTTRFIAMELVAGEDLSERLLRGPLTLDQTLATMGRIADALSAAHSKGVVHRDLKPANIRLTPDGRVKVLDFGLAKSVHDEGASEPDSTSNVALTATGVVLGTAPYMSPEQARGQVVDARTDMWSFGCVLWECLTGDQLARGESIPDLMVSILNEEPDWNKLPGETPPALRRLLRRCLAKSRRQRLHHIADARIELEEAAEEVRGIDVAQPATALPARRQWRRLALPLIALILVAAAAGWFAREPRSVEPDARRDRLLADAEFDWITIFPGEEVDASISPDGEHIAFLGDQAGQFDAYAGRVGAGEFVKLNGDAPIISPKYTQAGVRRTGFSGKGDRVWLGGSDDRKLRLISWPGLQSRPWLDKGVIHADWSPDMSRVVYSLSDGGDPLFLADADGTNPTPLSLPTSDGYHQHFPTWSPDGKWIYLCRGRVIRGEMDLWRVRPDGSDRQQLTTTVGDVAFPVPIDDRTVLFIGRERDGSGPWLWELDLDTRVPRRATSGVLVYKSLSASRDRRRLVATVAKPQVRLFTVPILPEKQSATEDDVKGHPLSAVRALGPRITDDRLYYLSSIGGNDSLWCVQGDRAEPVWKAKGFARLEQAAAVSPNRERVAIVVREDSVARLWLINPDGTQPRMLGDRVDVVGGASWSPDGEWIAVGGVHDGETGLFKIRVADAHVEKLQSGEAMNPVWSPDNGMIVYAGGQVGPAQLLMAVAPDGTKMKFPMLRVAVLGQRVRFMPDGKSVVVMMGLDPRFELRRFDLEAGTSWRIAKFDSSASTRFFDITPDGKTIIFDRQQDNADIVLIDRGPAPGSGSSRQR